MRSTLPALAVVAAAAVTLALGDVGLGSIATYAGGLALFVLAPGIALYRALAADPGSRIRQLAFGWALGEAVLIGTYLLAGVLGLRGVFWLFPLAVLAGSLPFARRAARHETGPTAAQAWALAGIVVAFIAAAASVRFPATPILGTLGPSANWDKDTVYFLSLAGEAKWHVPLEDPNVSGVALYYHYLSFVDLGGFSRLTGLELSDLMLRFDIVVPHVLVGLVLLVAGRAISGRWSVGLIAAALVLLLGELDLDRDVDKTFRGRFAELERDTSFHYGLIFGIPALVLMAERLGLTRDGRAAPGRGDWVLLGLLLAAAAGSKAPVAEVLLGGMALYVFINLVVRRSVRRVEWGVLGMTVGGFAVALALAYPRGSAGTTLTIQFGAIFDKMPLIQSLGLRAPHLALPEPIAWPLGVVVGLVGMLAPVLLGLLLAARHGDDLDGRLRTLLLSVFAAGLLVTVTFVQAGNSEEYFLWYGYPAAALVAAAGFDRYRRTRLAEPEVLRGFLAGLAVAVGAGVLIALVLPGILAPHPRGLGWLPASFADRGASVGLVALVAVAAALACLARAPASETAPVDVRRLVPEVAGAILLAVLVLVVTERVLPPLLTTVLDREYGSILPLHIRLAFVVFVLAAAAVAVAGWWVVRTRWGGTLGLQASRLALLAGAAVVAILAPQGAARVPLAGFLTSLQPVVIMPILLGLALLAAPALASVPGPLPAVRAWRPPPRSRAAWLVAGALITALAGVLVFGALGSDRYPSDPTASGLTAFAGGVLGAAVFLVAAHAGTAVRTLAAPLAVAVVLAPTLLDFPLDILVPAYHRARGELPAPSGPDPRMLTPAIADGLVWVRDHSDPGDVLVVNNQFEDVARQDPRYFFYSALAERRTYLSGWDYSYPIQPLGAAPSPALRARQKTNRAAVCGDAATLARLYATARVRWVVIDKVHPANPGHPSTLERAFSNRDIDVYRVPPRPSGPAC